MSEAITTSEARLGARNAAPLGRWPEPVDHGCPYATEPRTVGDPQRYGVLREQVSPEPKLFSGSPLGARLAGIGGSR